MCALVVSQRGVVCRYNIIVVINIECCITCAFCMLNVGSHVHSIYHDHAPKAAPYNESGTGCLTTTADAKPYLDTVLYHK